MRIDRCICFQMKFSELKRVAERTGASTIEELQRAAEFGLRCRLCHPYVQRMLRTGETVFTEVLPSETARE